MNISKGQQKSIVILAAIIFGTSLFFWMFVYVPKRKQMNQMQAELYGIRDEINKIGMLVATKKDLDILIDEYASKMDDFKRKLPAQEETTLRELVRQAADMGIEVISVRPEPLEDTGLHIQVAGYQCKELDIKMKLVTTYMKMGRYLYVLENDFASMLRVKELDLEKSDKSKDDPELNVTMVITFYMLIPD